MNDPNAGTPAIRFGRHAVAEGPLNRFDEFRPELIHDVVERTCTEFRPEQQELLLGEALYLERQRIKRERWNLFTKRRRKRDVSVLNRVQAGLLRPSAEVARSRILQELISYYAEEIGGHFDPRVYRVATTLVPWGFNWLLNAASVRRFVPWKMRESLKSRFHVLGEIEHLQKLARQGTILLVPTHQSNLDSVLIGYVIHLMDLPPFAYGAGLNLFSNPALGFFMSNLGAYTVDRQKRNDIYKATLKNYSTRILREGVHSIFFPGGGRSRSGAIESHLKLGLLGTGLEAQLDNLLAKKPNPNVYVVPMVMSYHFVLEASSLIEDYLAEAGRHRYIIMDDESWQPFKIAGFFWKFFSSQSSVTVRIGKPMDVFGNFVDEQGRSIGPNGTTIEPERWLTTCGELRHETQRDHEYTRELGKKISERFHRENTVLTSHAAAFAFFESLRKRYEDLDLFRFLRLSQAQRSLPYADFVIAAEALRARLAELERQGELYLSEKLKHMSGEEWIKDGIAKLGVLHESAVLRARDGAVWTEDMNLLYYYRNRLAGYGLSNDAKGFLA